MAKKRSATKESEGPGVKAPKSSETKPQGSSERNAVETPKRQDVEGPGRAAVEPETPERHDADKYNAFKLQSGKVFEAS
jgi:hypothetical protein